MTISSVLSTAVSGLKASSLRVRSAADNITNFNTKGYEASTVAQSSVTSGSGANAATAVNAQIIGSGQPPDLGRDIVRLLEAEATYKANAEVIRTAEKISRETFDIRT